MIVPTLTWLLAVLGLSTLRTGSPEWLVCALVAGVLALAGPGPISRPRPQPRRRPTPLVRDPDGVWRPRRL